MKSEYCKYLEDVVKIKATEPALCSSVKQELQCMICGGSCNATPKSKVSNYKKYGAPGCPKCTKSSRYDPTREEMKLKIEAMGFVLHEEIVHYKHKILVNNSNCDCGRSWETTPESILSGRSFCRPCNDDKKRSRFDDINAQRAVQEDGTLESYRTIVRRLSEVSYREHEAQINPLGLTRARSGTEGGYHLDHIVPIVQAHRLGIPPEDCASPDNLRVLEWSENAKKWSKPVAKVPNSLKKYFKTKNHLHDKCAARFEDLGVKYKEHQMCNDVSFDFLVEDILWIKICEFHEFVEQSIKSKKAILEYSTEKTGKSSFVVFENEILDAVKFATFISRILNKIGHKTVKRIYARKCMVESVEKPEMTSFFKENHMQGKANADVCMGLRFGGEIVAMLSFAKPRAFIGHSADSGKGFEIVRYATLKGTSVVGGASKLLKAFERAHSPVRVYSYSDSRWGTGNLYQQIGMDFVKHTGQNYWYIVDGEPKHRFVFAKHRIKSKFPNTFDPARTEYQNMLENGIDRIWDCGSNLYEKLYKI